MAVVVHRCGSCTLLSTCCLWGKGILTLNLIGQINYVLFFYTQSDVWMFLSLCLSPGDHLSSQQGPPPLPPAPPPHKQHPSITSLSRSSLANQRSPSPPPSAGLAADLQSTAECVQLQDSWVLGSNVALESRWVTHNELEQGRKLGFRCGNKSVHSLRQQHDVKPKEWAFNFTVPHNVRTVVFECELYTFYIW